MREIVFQVSSVVAFKNNNKKHDTDKYSKISTSNDQARKNHSELPFFSLAISCWSSKMYFSKTFLNNFYPVKPSNSILQVFIPHCQKTCTKTQMQKLIFCNFTKSTDSFYQIWTTDTENLLCVPVKTCERHDIVSISDRQQKES